MSISINQTISLFFIQVYYNKEANDTKEYLFFYFLKPNETKTPQRRKITVGAVTLKIEALGIEGEGEMFFMQNIQRFRDPHEFNFALEI